MCVSLPGRVVSVQDATAVVEIAGASRWCNALLEPELRPGDWVLVHAGLVLCVLPEEEARQMEEDFAELDRFTGAMETTDGGIFDSTSRPATSTADPFASRRARASDSR